MAKHRESPDIEAFINRMFRALVKRAEDGDLEAVEALANLALLASTAANSAGAAAWRNGYSYTQIGDALGITRQAARQRFGSFRNAGAVPAQLECVQ